MEGLVENPPHCKALRRSKVDKLPVALVYPPDLGVAEVRGVLAVPHVGEDQVGALVACVHLSENIAMIAKLPYFNSLHCLRCLLSALSVLFVWSGRI